MTSAKKTSFLQTKKDVLAFQLFSASQSMHVRITLLKKSNATMAVETPQASAISFIVYFFLHTAILSYQKSTVKRGKLWLHHPFNISPERWMPARWKAGCICVSGWTGDRSAPPSKLEARYGKPITVAAELQEAERAVRSPQNSRFGSHFNTRALFRLPSRFRPILSAPDRIPEIAFSE